MGSSYMSLPTIEFPEIASLSGSLGLKVELGSLVPGSRFRKGSVVEGASFSAVPKYFMCPDGPQKTFSFGAVVRHCEQNELPG